MKKQIVTMVAVLALPASLCVAEMEAGEKQKPQAHQEVSAGDIAAKPDQFYEKSVRVKAEVEDVYGAHAFSLDEDKLFAGPDVLVLVPRPTGTIKDDTMVTVEGIVRPLVVTELERDYDWFDSDSIQPDVLVRFKERPIIVAESVISATGGKTAGDAPADDELGTGEPAYHDPAAEDEMGTAGERAHEQQMKKDTGQIDTERAYDEPTDDEIGDDLERDEQY